MALSIQSQTHIVIVGQAPNRAPYTQLFDLLQESIGTRAKVSWLDFEIREDEKQYFRSSKADRLLVSNLSGEDIWDDLIATATNSLPLSTADEIERAAIANGAHTKKH